MKVVIALGGNALLRRGEAMTSGVQTENARRAAAAVAAVAASHEVVVTHGNGPQVGLLALQSEAYVNGPSVPLDVLGAESGGMIGYLLDRELTGLLPDRSVVTLLTQTVVDPNDPAFGRPSKPIGPVYPKASGLLLARKRGWTMGPDGTGVRRVVASPAPLAIVELQAIRILMDHNVLVICTGGGGVPVALLPDLRLQGVEAVVDKDAASSLLARELGADALLLLTDVDRVYTDWPRARCAVDRIAVGELERHRFAEGSMGPKVAAACAFARGGGTAMIGALDMATDVLQGRAGTTVLPG